MEHLGKGILIGSILFMGAGASMMLSSSRNNSFDVGVGKWSFSVNKTFIVAPVVILGCAAAYFVHSYGEDK